MNKKKIIFFDIDGTLLPMHHKQLSPATLKCLQKLQSQGILLVLATGRSAMPLPNFDGIHFDAFLTFNGSVCFNQEGILYHQPIPKEDVKKIYANAKTINRPIAFASLNELIASGYDQDLADYYAFANQKLIPDVDFAKMFDKDIYQIMMGAYEHEYEAILKDVRGAKIASWWHRAIDIIPAHSGKGIAIEKMLEVLNIDKQHAMAFGDGNNDIEMLQTVGWGVAMANASDKLKAVANDICDSVENDGIYHYCLKHHII